MEDGKERRKGRELGRDELVEGCGSMCSIEESCEDEASKRACVGGLSGCGPSDASSMDFFHDLMGRTVGKVGYGRFLSSGRVRPKSPQRLLVDRFVPNRAASHTELLLADTSAVDENSPCKEDSLQSKAVSVWEMYRQQVLGVPPASSKEQPGCCYRNNNCLKFSQKLMARGSFPEPSALLNISELSETAVPVLQRKISKAPIKVLDAPSLQDDFYLNLVDWSDQNVLAVGLNASVYLWNAYTARVSKLCELGLNDTVTAVCWSQRAGVLSLGTNAGEVQLWDVEKLCKIRTLVGHMGRVGSIAWNSPSFFSSGSRDKHILHRDLRENGQFCSKLSGHRQEVCGLKWSFDRQQLASGGNDNWLMVWNTYSGQPLHTFTQHHAAVKALAWSPHQHGLLASGGGTADRTIRFWNTLTGEMKQVVEAGSQVCNLMFSKTVNELVSTHGYSLNEINIWAYPKMQKIATLTGHTYRVLYLAMNPEGSTIVTGAGDETLRFWNVFPGREPAGKSPGKAANSQLADEAACLR